MENNALIDALPLWGLFIAILGVVLISVECGYRLGKFRLSRLEQEKEAPVGRWSELRLVYSPSFLRSHLGWHPADSITEDSYCLMKRTRSGRPTCVQACFREWGEEVRRLLRDYIGHRLDAVR